MFVVKYFKTYQKSKIRLAPSWTWKMAGIWSRLSKWKKNLSPLFPKRIFFSIPCLWTLRGKKSLGNLNLFVIHRKKEARNWLSQLVQVSSTVVWGQLKLDGGEGLNHQYLQYLRLQLRAKAEIQSHTLSDRFTNEDVAF